jgi:hypothetical protein
VRGSSNCNVHNFSSDSNNATLALLQIQLSGQDQEKDEEKERNKERKKERCGESKLYIRESFRRKGATTFIH